MKSNDPAVSDTLFDMAVVYNDSELLTPACLVVAAKKSCPYA